MRQDQLEHLLVELSRFGSIEVAAAHIVVQLDTSLYRPWHTAAPIQRMVDRIEVPR